MIKRILALLLLIPASCWALSLGDLEVHSHLNQPLQAEIGLSDLGDIPADQLQIRLASQVEFARAHMAKTNVVRNLQFKIIHTQSQASYIQITSNNRINEPFISFLLQASWSKGDYIKKYILLLDPVAATSPNKIVVAQHKATFAVQRDIPKVVENIYGSTEKNQHLWSIAQQVRPDKNVSIEQTMIALVQYNPNAFLLHNVNGLMEGYYLRIPSSKQINATSAAAALEQIKQHNRYWKLKKKIKITLKAKAAPTRQPQPQQATTIAKAATDIAKIAKSPGLELPATNVSMRVKSPQQSINEDQIISLRAELDAALKDNELLKQKNMTIQQQVSKLQQQNKQLQSDATTAQQSTVRLQQLMNSQAKQVVQTKKSSIGLGTWLRKNWGLALGALAIIGLLILFIFNRRRNKPNNDGEPEDITRITKTVMVDIPDELNDASLDIETEFEREKLDIHINSVEQKPAEDTINVNDVLPDVTVKEMHRARPELATSEHADINALLEEAKLYVDYGRHEQATEMLQKAIDSKPSDILQWENLLHIVTDLGNKKLFGSAVAKIPAELLNADEQALWQTVESLRENFKNSDVSVDLDEQENAELAAAEETELVNKSEEGEITLSPLSSEETLQLNTTDEGDAKDQINLDLSTESAAELDDDMGLKLTDDEELDITIESDSPQQQNPHDVIANEDSDMSKLDLIRAYIEMGDNDSAKKLLHELLKYGKPTSKQQAEQLLTKLEQ